MSTGSILAFPQAFNMTTIFLWFWSLLPTTWANTLLKSYIFATNIPSKIHTQVSRSYTALKHSFESDAYWFYNVGDHFIAQHMNSAVMKVHKGKPTWLYTPHTNVFSYVAPITHADTNGVVNQLVNEPVVTRRFPMIGATLYFKTPTNFFEYDMSEWISSVRIVSPESSVADTVPLSVLVLAWGLANEVCFKGDLSTMEIVLMSDVGDEKRFNVVTEFEVEEGEITAANDDLVVSDDEEDTNETVEAVAAETADEELSSESENSPAPEHRPLLTTPINGLEEVE